jgi:hypothetical protein
MTLLLILVSVSCSHIYFYLFYASFFTILWENFCVILYGVYIPDAIKPDILNTIYKDDCLLG